MKAAPRVQIIDYRLGNLFSVQQACQRVGMEAFVSDSTDALSEADGLILPGVGAFGDAMENLRKLNLIEPLCAAASRGKPLMGICLGMQLLFDQSEEFGNHAGLGLLAGQIRRIPDQNFAERKLRVPNVGWNQVQFCDRDDAHAIRAGIPDDTYMYFVHSYYADPADPADRLTTTRYGEIRYCSSVLRGTILGVQFHPEKSAELGLQFYRNWAQSL
ncbi:MAG: imidazole glycerol phosphate synthase subunit HisH [Pirellulales bacterium]|nr:imidazole glycerol phosphate synthase subunit HisH [Pirellulales bacterium]